MIDNYKADATALKDRVILITGAGSGIGAVAAKTYAQYGATVILLGKTVSKLETVYDEIVAAGGPQPAIYPLNLVGASRKDYEDMANTIENELGQLNGILHNAAFVGETTPLQYYDMEIWQRVLHVNVTAPLMLTNACLPLLHKSNNPRIVFTSHRVDSAYWGAYGVAKAGVERLVQILSDELSGDKFIAVNAVIPGDLQTPLMARVYPGKDLRSLPPIKTVMPTYLYLMDTASNRLTGKIISATVAAQ